MIARTRTRRTALAASLAAASLLALAACAGSSGDNNSASVAPAAADAPERARVDALSPAQDFSSGDTRDGAQVLEDAAADSGTADTGAMTQAVIATGSISLESDDVSKARFDVQAVIDEHGGTTAQEKTETNDDGDAVRARMVFRVPVKEFDDTMTALEDIGVTKSSSTDTEDVTTQVIDTDVRVRAQEKSIERIEILYSRAQSIRDIMAIEAQLQRRQAELESLKQQQAWLADQTSMSTITVHVQTPPKVRTKVDHESGFAAGLASGWHALKKAAIGVSTALGAFLPFAVLALVVGIPLWLLVRSRLRRRPVGTEPEPEPAT